MEKKIKEKGLQKKVFLVGAVPNASRFLKAFDVFVLPSRYEGFSITVLETLFADVPMLVTKVGGNREAVAGFDPFLYKLDDTEEFKNKLHNLLNDKDLRARAREVSRKESYRFGNSATVNGYVSVLKGVYQKTVSHH